MTEPNSDLIVIHHKQAFTNTMAIAEGVGLEHASVIKLVRRFETDFEESSVFCDLKSRKTEGLRAVKQNTPN